MASFDSTSEPEQRAIREAADGRRNFLGIHFRCCRVYGRLYRTPGEAEYRGRCPRCGAVLEVPVGEGGTGRRFFTAE